MFTTPWIFYSWFHISDLDDGRVSITTDCESRKIFRQRGQYYIRIFFFYSALLWFVLSVQFGVVYKNTLFAQDIHLQIIDLDQTPTSRQLVNIAQRQNAIIQSQLSVAIANSIGQPQWEEYNQHSNGADDTQNGAHTLSSLDECKEYIRKHGWAAIVLTRGLEERLQKALTDTDLAESPQYNPSDAMVALISTGRNIAIANPTVQPALVAMAQHMSNEYSRQQIQLLRRQQPQVDLNNVASQALITPVGYTQVEVSPYSFGIAPIAPMFAIFISLSCTIAPHILFKASSVELFEVVNHYHLVLAFLFVMFAGSSILSLFSTLAFLAFRGPTYNSLVLGLPFNARRFFAVFASYDLTILAATQWLFFWTTLLPPDLLPVAHIGMMVPDTASCTISIELVPHGLRWLAAMPSHNGSMLFQYIVSGAYPQVGLNVGVLVASNVFMGILNVLAILVRQHWLFLGTVDRVGWFKSSTFYCVPPKYTTARVHLSDEDGFDQESPLESRHSSLPSDQTTTAEPRPSSVAPGRQTIVIEDEKAPDEDIRYTLYGT
ncbi:hypothetical protein GGI07_004139 [Coemansia sp. Benny D115]|nr:hypothetical protein GGI07_004139 [Coemansia sp. Benny D115]